MQVKRRKYRHQVWAAIGAVIFGTTLVPSAFAIIGPSGDGAQFTDRVVMVLNKGNGQSGFCSGVVLTQDVILTAAQCIRSNKADMEIFYRNSTGENIFVAIEASESHPGYVPDAIKIRVESIDLALVKAVRPLDAWFRPALLDRGHYPSLGERVSVVGFGGTVEHDWNSSGTLRVATLHVREPLSTVLIWANEPGAISGACNGDAGGPIFADDNERVIAITAWAQAVHGRGCGGLTQGPLIAPNVEWIDQVLARWGEARITAIEPKPNDNVSSSSKGSVQTVSPNAVPMISDGGTFTVPVTINGQLTLKFVVDSGASDVTIPADVVLTLVRTETITDADFLGKQTYQMADGSTVPSQRFVIRSLKVGDKLLENVTGSIAPVTGSLLLGQSFLSRFKSWSIDNQRQALILNN